MKAVSGFIIISVVLLSAGVCGEDDFFEKSDCKKSSFEKRLYYSLEKTDGISQQQKDAINQALKEFQSQKEKQMVKNVKKFQSDDIPKDTIRVLVDDSSGVGYSSRASLLGGIHKILNQKQREQFIKKIPRNDRLSKILLIEDDKEIGELLSEHLGGYGMNVVCAEKPSEAFEALKSNDFDLVVLDLMLPEMNGFEVCKKIKSEYDLPIIISSARGNTSDKVLGLDLGADDYLTKGYEPIELVKRIEAVLRRYKKIEKDSDVEFTVDERAMTIKFKGEPLALTNSEYELMRLFLNSKGKALNRDDIANAIEFLNWDSTSRNVDVLVSKLRNKLGDDPKNPKYIKSVWGHGYKFIGQ